MPRKGPVPKRDVLPDPIYNSKIFTKLVNQLMWDGKKSLAEKICYGAFEIVQSKTRREPLEVFEEAMKN
ncbi:MAG TPA: 30S ribosomal protein S7, partial [Syntrophomonas wolfei]|nr:30S ribosomal protein S7 [Syntrophomonas wolfei]